MLQSSGTSASYSKSPLEIHAV